MIPNGHLINLTNCLSETSEALFVFALTIRRFAPVGADDHKVGDSVLAHWEQGDAYFVATIVEDKESDFFVVFEDGDTASVKKTLIRKNDIKAGSKVVARWKNGQYYRATVGKIVGRALYIHYDDGSKGWAPWAWIAVKEEK